MTPTSFIPSHSFYQSLSSSLSFSLAYSHALYLSLSLSLSRARARALSLSVRVRARACVISTHTCTGVSKMYNDVWASHDGANWELILPAAPWPPRCGHSVALFPHHNVSLYTHTHTHTHTHTKTHTHTLLLSFLPCSKVTDFLKTRIFAFFLLRLAGGGRVYSSGNGFVDLFQ